MNFLLIRPLAGVLLISSLQAAEHFWDEIPVSPSTTVPSVVLDDYWNGEFQRVNREVAAAQDPQLVFFGDSITWFWSLGDATGRQVWEDQFKAYGSINMGNSGDITPVMLHRIIRGNLDFPTGRHPKVAVMLCGINNFGVTKSAAGKEKWDLGIDCPPEDIAHAQRAIAQVFRRKLPHTRLIMMGLLPLSDSVKWERCQQVNAINAKLSWNPDEVTFINLQDSFILPDGSINRALYSDGLHLSAEGYRVWAKGITPWVEKFMKSPPLAPVKIMVIGGSATEGLDSSTSYRRYLDGMLRRDGHLIDFVGSRHKHNNGKTEPDSYQFVPDHEGHWGRDSAWFAENMPRLLEWNVPDVAVIHLGTEDIMGSRTADGPLTDGIVHNIDRVVEALRSRNENIRIVIVESPPLEGREETSVMLGSKVSLLAHPMEPGGHAVVIADIKRDLVRKNDMLNNGSLPNANGAEKIATVLAECIKSLLAPRLDHPSAK